MSQKILDLYSSILESASCKTENGLVSHDLAGEVEPVLIEGKRLCLPTREILSNPDRDNLVVFHPLAEHLTRINETPSVEKLRGLLNTRLDFCLGMFAVLLMRLAASPAANNKLNPVQNEFLTRMPNASEKTVEKLEKLLSAKPVDGIYKTFVAMYIKRNGIYKGKNHKRVAVVYFPLYEELRDNKKKVLGVDISDKDRETIMALLEYLVPGIENPDSYNVGSNSDVAPIMDSLMHGFAGIAGCINGLADTYKDVFDTTDMSIPCEWEEDFQDLTPLVKEIRLIPRQGMSIEPDVEVQAQTVSQVAPAAPAGRNPFPWEVKAPSVTPPPIPGIGPGFNAAPVYQAPPVQVQPAAPQAPQRTANGGLDFAALMRSRPEVFGAASSYNPTSMVQTAPRRQSYYETHGHRPQYTGQQTNYNGIGGSYRR